VVLDAASIRRLAARHRQASSIWRLAAWHPAGIASKAGSNARKETEGADGRVGARRQK
jgi:hypothetical protein